MYPRLESKWQLLAQPRRIGGCEEDEDEEGEDEYEGGGGKASGLGGMIVWVQKDELSTYEDVAALHTG